MTAIAFAHMLVLNLPSSSSSFSFAAAEVRSFHRLDVSLPRSQWKMEDSRVADAHSSEGRAC